MESERKPEMESERKPETESEIEMESETESEMEPEMKIGDCSEWHHLIFVEELADDVRAKAWCGLCRRQALGPVYKCLECRFIQHKSCPPIEFDWEKQMESHFYEPRHHLMLVEGVENNGEEEVCDGCEEALCTPAYKCSIPGCSFLFHHSCAQLPHVVQHPTHQDYMLTLQNPWWYENVRNFGAYYRQHIIESLRKKCNFCLKTSKCLFYGCEPLDFHLHIKCLPLWQRSAYDRHEHTVFTRVMDYPFTCQACGEKSKAAAYTCDICRLMMEKSCCDFSHSIQTRIHGHYLIFTHSVRQINKQDRIFCRICRKQVNKNYGAYYCESCGFILHLKCARRYEDRDAIIDESEPGECDEHTKYLVEGLEAMEGERFDGPETIKHFNHPEHDLLLKHEEPGYDKRCEACMRFIFFVPYYGCVECNFFLHPRCAELPMTITRRLFHEHPLTLCSQTPSREKIFQCFLGCFRSRDGYSYKCEKCGWFELDVQCGLIPEAVPHILHEHTLFLVDSNNARGHCKHCGMTPVSFICNNDCEFNLCLKCITIPPYVRYRYHSHPLTITNTCVKFETDYCLICEKISQKICFYWCKECDFTVHCNCILKGNFKDYEHYVSEDHEHPLFFVQKTKESEYHEHSLSPVQKTKDFPPCAACGQSFDTCHTPWAREVSNQAVECRQCKFVIHRSCQTKMFTKQS